MIKTEVCIIGAGPGGAMTALRLAKEGIPFVIIEKHIFPRDKICGDGLTPKVGLIMKRIAPELYERFITICSPVTNTGLRFVAAGDYLFDFPYASDASKEGAIIGHSLPRKVFDAFMANEVSIVAGENMMCGHAVKSVQKTADGFVIHTDYQEVHARILIDASGATSYFKTDYDKPKSKANKTHLSVRAYYKGVTDCEQKDYLEFFFIEGTPLYLYLFPLPGGMANVGLGGRKDLIQKQKLELSKSFDNIVRTHPMLVSRFSRAERTSKIAAYPIPLGKPGFAISGDHYMLVGDAAHLADPLTGEGVGNAFYSGYFAAEQAIQCMKHNRFHANYMRSYDKRINRVMGFEFRIHRLTERFMSKHKLSKWLAKKAYANKYIKHLLSAVTEDDSYRKNIKNPLFVIKRLLNI